MLLIAVLLTLLPLSGLPRGVRQDTKKTDAAQAPASDPIVVKALGQTVTEKQVVDAINQIVLQLARDKQITQDQIEKKDILYFRDALDTLVGTILLKNEALEKHYVVDKAKVEENLQSMKAQYPNEESFQKAIAAQGLKEEDLRRTIEINLLCQQVLDEMAKSLPPPTAAEIQKFYDDNPKYFDAPEQVHAAHIFLRVDANASPEQKAAIRKKLEDIRADIESQKISFAAAAIRNSEDKANAPSGGDLGMVKRGDMLKPIEDAVFGAKSGTLSQIVETQYGYHLINIIEVQPAGKMPLESVKEKIVAYLEHKALQDATTKHIEDLKAKYKVEVVMSTEEWNKRHTTKK
jgi:peptidyl-prolyl cis-trans isomerase C